MLTLTKNMSLVRTVKIGLAAAVISLSATSVQADEMFVSNVVSSIETNIKMATTEMLVNMKQDFINSVQSQISQEIFEVSGDADVVEQAQAAVAEAVITLDNDL